jgi:hypothetical protein
MSVTISPEKLKAFESLKLDAGSHGSFDKGHCAMEVVSWLADEGFTDAPECASPVLRRYLIALNDRWDDEKRQLLKPYLLRTIGTAGDGLDEARERIAAEWATKNLVAPWLRLAGLNAEADSVEAVDPSDRVAVRDVLYRARKAAWAKRDANWAEMRKVVADKLAAKQAPAALELLELLIEGKDAA